MQAFVVLMRALDVWMGVDFYRRYVRCAWICGTPDIEDAEARLRHKLNVHELWLADVNEAIALDPWSRPDGRSLYHRIYNINERARILAALEELEGIKDIQDELNFDGYASLDNIISPFGEDTIDSTIQDASRAPADSLEYDISSDGASEIPFVRHARTMGPVSIIDPHTGRPIDLLGISKKAKNRDAGDHGHENGGTVIAQRKELAKINAEKAIYNSIAERTSISIAVGSMNLSPDIGQSSERIVKELTDRDSGMFLAGDGQLTSEIPQEILTVFRPVRERVLSKTVPRNFGCPRYGPGLRTITEIDQDFFSPGVNEADAIIAGGRAVSSPVMRR
jgi:hypothetical protein